MSDSNYVSVISWVATHKTKTCSSPTIESLEIPYWCHFFILIVNSELS